MPIEYQIVTVIGLCIHLNHSHHCGLNNILENTIRKFVFERIESDDLPHATPDHGPTEVFFPTSAGRLTMEAETSVSLYDMYRSIFTCMVQEMRPTSRISVPGKENILLYFSNRQTPDPSAVSQLYNQDNSRSSLITFQGPAIEMREMTERLEFHARHSLRSPVQEQLLQNFQLR